MAGAEFNAKRAENQAQKQMLAIGFMITSTAMQAMKGVYRRFIRLREKTRSQKNARKAAESQASSARFVGPHRIENGNHAR
jgi:hypothetical protein